MFSDTSSIIASLGKKPRILVIRRDNIGDLVCTTPAFTLLRQRFPDAYIAALVNSYNAPVVVHNTDINEVFSYTKGKHTGGLKAKLNAWINKVKMLQSLRKQHFDLAIVANTVPTAAWIRLAKWSGARHILSAPTGLKSIDRSITLPIQNHIDQSDIHMTEQIVGLLKPLGINSPPPKLVLNHQLTLSHTKTSDKSLCIGIHISARKPRQRWQVENFIELIKQLHDTTACTFKLFWAPGKSTNTQHPGDDEKAEAIIQAINSLDVFRGQRQASIKPNQNAETGFHQQVNEDSEKGIASLQPIATHTLSELIDGLATVDMLICSDGGAMHLAAALEKPIICFFGNSDANIWSPWKVPHQVLQPTSQNVQDITVDQAFTATLELLNSTNLLANHIKKISSLY